MVRGCLRLANGLAQARPAKLVCACQSRQARNLHEKPPRSRRRLERFVRRVFAACIMYCYKLQAAKAHLRQFVLFMA